MKEPFMGDGKLITGANVLSAFRFWCAWKALEALLASDLLAAFIWGLIGVLTDLFDGKVAKMGWLGGTSNFGKILDPLADKAMILVPTGGIAWMLYTMGHFAQAVVVGLAVLIVLCRELIVWRIKIALKALENGVQSAIESARASMLMQSVGFLSTLLSWFLSVLDVMMVFPGMIVSASIVSGWDYFTKLKKLRQEKALESM